jgi:hypothetical protein
LPYFSISKVEAKLPLNPKNGIERLVEKTHQLDEQTDIFCQGSASRHRVHAMIASHGYKNGLERPSTLRSALSF